jgi:glutamate formiminotransferase / 5-formyltetrahydrofolate cyclo-ligase
VTLFAVPNVSAGRDPEAVAAIAGAFGVAGVQVLDVHRDPDHNRAVVWLAGEPGCIAEALAAGAQQALARIDLRRHAGVHPHVGALDVAPVVYLDARHRGAACAEALVAGDLLARELDLPVFLYGALAGGRTRAELRRGGPAGLAARLATGELVPDFGPARLHPTGGAVLVSARSPLIAFNLELHPAATLTDARRVARAVREGGPDGLPGVRALGLELPERGVVQISCNVEDPDRVPLAVLVAAVRRHADVVRAELVGLAPETAWAGFPDDLAVPGFDPDRHLLERRLGRVA